MIQQSHFWVYIQKNLEMMLSHPCSLQYYSQWPKSRSNLNVQKQMKAKTNVVHTYNKYYSTLKNKEEINRILGHA
jgi:hypothetical protein